MGKIETMVLLFFVYAVDETDWDAETQKTTEPCAGQASITVFDNPNLANTGSENTPIYGDAWLAAAVIIHATAAPQTALLGKCSPSGIVQAPSVSTMY